jgi:Na+-transporting methylmalonyl-CoA/oxaloacetate decarboxylase gamma subunit
MAWWLWAIVAAVAFAFLVAFAAVLVGAAADRAWEAARSKDGYDQAAERAADEEEALRYGA